MRLSVSIELVRKGGSFRVSGPEGVSIVRELPDGPVIEAPLEHRLRQAGLIAAGFIVGSWWAMERDLGLAQEPSGDRMSASGLKAGR